MVRRHVRVLIHEKRVVVAVAALWDGPVVAEVTIGKFVRLRAIDAGCFFRITSCCSVSIANTLVALQQMEVFRYRHHAVPEVQQLRTFEIIPDGRRDLEH